MQGLAFGPIVRSYKLYLKNLSTQILEGGRNELVVGIVMFCVRHEEKVLQALLDSSFVLGQVRAPVVGLIALTHLQ